MDVPNDVLYRSPKSEVEILCIYSYTKIGECIDLNIVNNAYFQNSKIYQIRHFCVA
jgi:hypothetical protein